MDITPIDDETSKENESLKNEIVLLKNEIKLLKQNCIYKIKIDTLLPKDLYSKKEILQINILVLKKEEFNMFLIYIMNKGNI